MKKRKSIISIVILSLVLLMSVAACGNTQNTTSDNGSNQQAEEDEKVFTLKMHHPGADGHPYTLGAEKFKELVEEKSDGSITVDIYPNNQLASGAKAVESVQFGTIDIALESTMALSNFVPEMGVINLPFLFPDREVAYKVLDGDIGKELAKKAEDKGFKILSYWDNGFRNISNSVHPINSPEDLKGLKIRVPESEVFISTFEALGAIPTPMAFSELFTALQLNTVDGQENPNGHLIEYKLHEVQKYFAVTNHIYTAEPIIITTDLFDQMSEKQQNAILEAAHEAGAYQRQLTSDREQGYLDEIKAEGIEVTTPKIKPFQEAVSPIFEKYNDEFGSTIEKILAIQ